MNCTWMMIRTRGKSREVLWAWCSGLSEKDIRKAMILQFWSLFLQLSYSLYEFLFQGGYCSFLCPSYRSFWSCLLQLTHSCSEQYLVCHSSVSFLAGLSFGWRKNQADQLS